MRDFPPEPIHTLIHAAYSSLVDLHRYHPNGLLERILQGEDDLIKDEYKGDYRRLKNRAANFLKHADQDPNEILTGIDLRAINSGEILICTLSVLSFPDRFTQKLAIGLLYFGVAQRHWFKSDGLSRTFGAFNVNISDYLGLAEPELKRQCLACYDHLLAKGSD